MSLAPKGPITKIRLPSHHPAINAAKDGHKLTLHVTHVPEAEMPRGMEDAMARPKGPKPPPLEQDYHVMHIESARGRGADPDEDEAAELEPTAPAKGRNPIAAIKAKRAAAKGY